MRLIPFVFLPLFGAYAANDQGPDAAASLKSLLEGNSRYVSSRTSGPHRNVKRRTEVASGQKPFAAILSCADSRVPPELVFDQGLGDLFTVRVAGNVPTDDVIASLEYAIVHLGPKLIVVLGHERCGAVDAAIKGGPAEGHLAALLDPIKPAVEASKNEPGDKLDNAIRANVRNVVKSLKSAHPILAERVESGAIQVVGARYDLDTGKVELVQ